MTFKSLTVCLSVTICLSLTVCLSIFLCVHLLSVCLSHCSSVSLVLSHDHSVFLQSFLMLSLSLGFCLCLSVCLNFNLVFCLSVLLPFSQCLSFCLFSLYQPPEWHYCSKWINSSDRFAIPPSQVCFILTESKRETDSETDGDMFLSHSQSWERALKKKSRQRVRERESTQKQAVLKLKVVWVEAVCNCDSDD